MGLLLTSRVKPAEIQGQVSGKHVHDGRLGKGNPNASDLGYTYSLHRSSFLGLPFRILNIDLMETIGTVVILCCAFSFGGGGGEGEAARGPAAFGRRPCK